MLWSVPVGFASLHALTIFFSICIFLLWLSKWLSTAVVPEYAPTFQEVYENEKNISVQQYSQLRAGRSFAISQWIVLQCIYLLMKLLHEFTRTHVG